MNEDRKLGIIILCMTVILGIGMTYSYLTTDQINPVIRSFIANGRAHEYNQARAYMSDDFASLFSDVDIRMMIDQMGEGHGHDIKAKWLEVNSDTASEYITATYYGQAAHEWKFTFTKERNTWKIYYIEVIY